MSKIIHIEKLTGTTASGTFSVNSSSRGMGLLRNIVIKPTTETTMYDVKLTNDLSLVVWNRTSETGSFTEQVALPFRGAYTLKISNATADEAFTVMLGVDE